MSYVSSYFHCVFSTKERRKFISLSLQERLWPFLVGIARDKEMTCIIAGGTDDHVHLLLDLPATMPVSKAMQLIKGASSKWIHETFADQKLFAWQEEYGAFSVSVSQLQIIRTYIKNQKAHHHQRSFQEEFLMLLKKRRVKFDERYLWR
jgi:putative transposase